MIRFCCEQCGCKISVKDEYARKKGKCPKCKNILIIPEKNDDFAFMEKPGELKLQQKHDNHKTTIEDNSEQDFYPSEHINGSEYDSQRKLPWLIDISLYPTSASGLTNLAIFTVIFTIIYILRTYLSTIGRIASIPLALVGLYMGWYFTECVRDSAKGRIRAPEAFAFMGIGEMWEQVQHIVGVYLIYLTPALFYNLYTNRFDTTLMILLITGTFFFPMALLTCIMFDSIRGLNPFLLLGSIFSTFLQYLCLVVLIFGIIFSFLYLSNFLMNSSANKIVGLVFFPLQIYLTLIIAHIIGRFFWRNEEKLNWEC